MEIFEIMKALAKEGISTSMNYSLEKEEFYIDLDTRAKSHLHLYENGVLLGRCFQEEIDLTSDIEDLIHYLCINFKRALWGRNYYNESWVKLCNSKGIVINVNP